MSKKWIEVWNANYNGSSDASKELDKFAKKNYQSHKYIPWSTMQRLLYQMDSDADIEVMVNDDGGHVFTDKVVVETFKEDAKAVASLRNSTYAHFVKIKLVFLGKTMIETYPVQDNAYKAPNYVDSNMINKSIQRAKAKGISAITGLAYSLYESGDLQFEDDDKPTNDDKAVISKVVTAPRPAPKAKPVAEKKVVEKVENNDEFVDLATYIIDNKDTIVKSLQEINQGFQSKYNTVLNPSDGVDGLVEKLKQVSNITFFANTVKKRHENEMAGK